MLTDQGNEIGGSDDAVAILIAVPSGQVALPGCGSDPTWSEQETVDDRRHVCRPEQGDAREDAAVFSSARVAFASYADRLM